MDIELGDECVFSDKDYSTICNFSQNGQLKELKEFLLKAIGRQRVGTQTFAADTTSFNPVRRLSPLSYAARSGKADIVKYFLQQFPDAISLNPTAEGDSEDPQQDMHHRHDLPLYWACLNGHLEVAKVLLEAGALINHSNCMLATPLHAAASSGHLQVMELLVAEGADVNAANILGQSALIAAASCGHSKAVEYLLGKGADVKQKTVDGYTLMHVAAKGGHLHTVRTLLARGIPPMFNKGTPNDKGFIPCPLFLAAVNGHQSVVYEFLSRKRNCPVACESDAMMLLGVGQQKKIPRTSYSVEESVAFGLVEQSWARGLELRRRMKLDLPTYKFRPAQMPVYGNRKELDSLTELSHAVQSGEERAYQSLIIMERCLGYGSQIITESCLGQERLDVLYFQSLADCIHRIMQAAILKWQTEVQRSIFRDPSTIQPLVENYLQRFSNRYSGCVHQSLSLGLDALDVLLQLRAVHICEGVSLQSALSSILYLFAIWLHQDYNSKRENLVGAETYLGPEECEQLGKKLVSEHLHSLEGTTLLHMALNSTKLLSEAKSAVFLAYCRWYRGNGGQASPRRYWPNLDLGLLIRALLRWGADAAIDVFDWNGQRPLHLAVKLTNMTASTLDVITPLVRWGAHLDYVNREGHTPLMLCQSDEVQQLLSPPGPLPLACLACHRIIKEKIAYKEMNIPTRVKNIIQNHDMSNVF